MTVGLRTCPACGFRHRGWVIDSVDLARHEAMHLKRFPLTNAETRANLRRLVELAKEREDQHRDILQLRDAWAAKIEAACRPTEAN